MPALRARTRAFFASMKRQDTACVGLYWVKPLPLDLLRARAGSEV